MMPAFIVADQGAIASRIREVLKFGGQDAPASNILSTDLAASRLARESSVDLVVVALSPEIEPGLELLPSLFRIAPGRILAVGPTADTRLVLRALRAGAADYVDAAELEVELEAAIRRIGEASRTPSEPGRLIAVLSPNGGSGASTLAANLAVCLAKEHKTAALVDMKLESGDLASLLDLKPTYTLADLCQNLSRLDRDMFERSVVKHDSGVSLLASPFHISDVARIRPEGVTQAILLARGVFPFVVADVSSTYREEQLVVLRQADVILLIFRLDFCSLRNVRRTLEYLGEQGVGVDKVQLVVGRSGQIQEVPSAKSQEALGRKIAHYVPEDVKTVNRANNHGVPVVIEAPSAKVSRSIFQIAASFNVSRKT
ncbi:AAA family ATPase [Tundrisphaera lichenicola]|uniref:AAA family ATPase n=1 Tax=Tundrisphaera lichenicola TaxID=2029860 RepID=UPI003EC125BF